MRKLAISFFAFVFALSLAAGAFAADKTLHGTITGIDASKGTVSFCPAGSTGHQDFNVGKSIDLSKFKKGEKVQVTVTPKNEVKEIKPDRPRRMNTGC